MEFSAYTKPSLLQNRSYPFVSMIVLEARAVYHRCELFCRGRDRRLCNRHGKARCFFFLFWSVLLLDASLCRSVSFLSGLI